MLVVRQVLTGMFSSTTGRIDDRWQRFMKFQIARARQCFADAEAGVDNLDADARWPVWSALILYRCGHILADRSLPIPVSPLPCFASVICHTVQLSARSACMLVCSGGSSGSSPAGSTWM